jgi:hypothetical protein
MGFYPVISNPTLLRRAQRLLMAALALSLFLHFAGFAVWGWIWGLPHWLRPQPHSEPMIVLSSATTISHQPEPVPDQPAHRATPQHPARPVPPRPPQRAALPTRATAPQRAVAVARPAHRELTYVVPSASPQPERRRRTVERPPSPQQLFTQRLAQEEQSFQREVVALRARNDPMSVATIPPRPPSSFRRAYFNVSGVDRNLDRYEGLVTPIETWSENGLRCHYATYDVEYTSGASDKGNIPWPLCYPPSQDPMMLPDGRPVPNGSPIPAIDLFPMQGYVLPPGTYLTDFLRQLYNRQL